MSGQLQTMSIEEQFEADTARIVTARLPYTIAGFLLSFALAWLIEHFPHPGRDIVYGVLFTLEALLCGLALAATRWLGLSDRRRIDVVTATVIGLLALVAVYHIAVSGELEILILAYIYFAVGAMVLFPWGSRGQLPVAVATLLFSAVALSTSVGSATPAGLNFLGLALTSGVTVAGAHLEMRSRMRLFRRDTELLQANAELEHEIAERRRAEKSTEEDAKISAALAHAGRTLISALDQPVLLDRLSEVSARALDCDLSHTLLRQPEGGGYTPVAGYGATPEEREIARVVTVPEQFIAVLLSRLENDDVAQVKTVPTGQMLPPAWETNVPRQVCMALRRGNEIIGVQVASTRAPGKPFTETQLRIARGIAQLASLALENARLLEKLEHANRLKSEFVSTMSHELRTPLNVIIGYHSLLIDGTFGPLTNEQTETLKRVDQSAQQLLELITATLDLSRLDSGSVEVMAKNVNVAELVAEVNEETREIQNKPGVVFAWNVAGDLPMLHTDPLKMKVVLKNLITNAVKFTERGSVTVSASGREDGIEFSVADTGIGIAPDAQERIFEPFHQANGATAPQNGGVGLGLHIASRLLDLLGGSIQVESELGRGSSFRAWIPCQVPASQPTRAHH